MGRAATVAISDAVIEQVNLVAFTNVVVLATPFQRITEPLTKPEPVTVSVKVPEVPATAVIGLRFVSEGIAVRLTALETRLVGAGNKTVMG
jgi:hypothetical protein